MVSDDVFSDEFLDDLQDGVRFLESKNKAPIHLAEGKHVATVMLERRKFYEHMSTSTKRSCSPRHWILAFMKDL